MAFNEGQEYDYQTNTPQNAKASSGSWVGFFFKGLWTLIQAYLMGVGILFSVLLIALLWGVSKCTSSHGLEGWTQTRSQVQLPTLEKDKKYLIELDLGGVIAESMPAFEERLLSKLSGEQENLTLSELRTAARRIALDNRVGGVFVDLSAFAADSAVTAELRNFLQKVKESNKDLSFWSSAYDTQSYLLASLGNIAMTPNGDLTLLGPVFQMAYFGEALKKIGVQVEVVRAGKYKSAMESFVANAPSEEAKTMMDAMEKSLRDFFITEIAAARNQPAEQVRGWLSTSMYSPQNALSAKIIDELLFRDESLDKAKGEEREIISLDKYLQRSSEIDKPLSDDTEKESKSIGLIEVSGEIMMDDGLSQSGYATPESIRDQAEWFIENEDVSAVVLRIDSPGGSAIASDMMWRDLKRLADKKPLIVSMGATAASGGYYMAVAGQKILAEPTTITGSIGVIGALTNISSFREKYGVSFHTFTQSERAKMINPSDSPTSYDKAIIEDSIRSTYELFLARVSEGRKIPTEKVDELGQGRVYTGLQAKEVGLIDELGGLTEAFRAAKEAASLNPDKLYPIERYKGDGIDWEECTKSYWRMLECLDAAKDVRLNLRAALQKNLRQPSEVSQLVRPVEEMILRSLRGGERVFVRSPEIRFVTR